MPSQKRITRSAIIGTAVSILRKEGYDGVNARKIAKEFGCSTQPIYSEFGNMNELKAELKKEAEASYVEKVKIFKDNSKFSPYIAYGLGFYILLRKKSSFSAIFTCATAMAAEGRRLMTSTRPISSGCCLMAMESLKIPPCAFITIWQSTPMAWPLCSIPAIWI